MKYRSTLRRSPEVSLREAVLRGSAPDGGLYMPVEMPRLADDFRARLPKRPFPEIAQEVVRPTAEERRANPRSTPAKLRWARKAASGG